MLNLKLLILVLPIHLVSCQDDSSNERSEIVALEQSTIDEQSAQPLSLRGGKLISEYPAIVGIGNDQARSCTGTVFTMNDSGKTCLLTAAHCINPETTSIWLGGDEKREYIPVLSDWKLDISKSRKLNQLDIAAIPIVPRVSLPRARLQSFGQHNLAPNEERISDRAKDGNSAVELWGFGDHYDTVGKKEVSDGKKRTGTASFI